MSKWWVRLLAVIAVVALLLVGAAYLVTNSDWGRERVRRYIVGILQRNSHGIIHIGSVSGNLLNGFTLHDVVITDSAHAPFVKADEIWARYSLGTLRGQKIDFREVRLVRPIVVIDKQPGGKWNYDRIFPRDTVTRTGVKKTGWGTWIRFADVTVLDGDLTVRAPWQPDPNITPAEQRDVVRRALGPSEFSSHQRAVPAGAPRRSRLQEPVDRCLGAQDDRRAVPPARCRRARSHGNVRVHGRFSVVEGRARHISRNASLRRWALLHQQR